MDIKNVAFYSFFKPSVDLQKTADLLRQRMLDLGIKGTILLADEGINASLCGVVTAMDEFLAFLFQTLKVQPPEIKVSFTKDMPFRRSLVKVKPFIVAKPGDTAVDLNQGDTAPRLSPQEFHQWVKDNKAMVVLDTRNDYEYELGRFKGSLHLGTKHFSHFEDDLKNAPEAWRDIPVVTFCTGGIRCEKAAPLMLKKGFSKVYQLDGGILNYFEKVGRGYFEGDCFVFDERRGVDDKLRPSSLPGS